MCSRGRKIARANPQRPIDAGLSIMKQGNFVPLHVEVIVIKTERVLNLPLRVTEPELEHLIDEGDYSHDTSISAPPRHPIRRG